MKKLFAFYVLLLALAGCDNSTKTSSDKTQTKTMDIREEAVTYMQGDSVFNGYITYDHNDSSARPAVMVVHEWWGLTEYARNRAKQLAELGYVAMAVDMYGGGRTAADPAEAQAMATPFYENPALAKTRLEAAQNKLTSYKEVNPAKVAAIGYCFGGFVVLNAAKLGENLAAVVSFHGGLGGVSPSKDLLKAKIFVAHGGNDQFVPAQEVDAFRKSMDSVGASYTFKVYPDATHAFTNPQATDMGKKFKLPIEYNAPADSASWADMKAFFKTVF